MQLKRKAHRARESFSTMCSSLTLMLPKRRFTSHPSRSQAARVAWQKAGWLWVSMPLCLGWIDRIQTSSNWQKQPVKAYQWGTMRTKLWPNLDWSKCMLRSGYWMRTQMKGGAPQKPAKGCRMKIWLQSSLSMLKMLWGWHLKPSSSCWVPKVVSLQRLLVLLQIKNRKSLKRLRMPTKSTMADSQGVWPPMGTR